MPVLNHSRVVSRGRDPEQWLLLLHGIYGSGRNWGSVIRRVVDARPEWGAVLVDLRLHGGSLAFDPPHTLEAAASDVAELVAELELPARAVVGHSFGGKVALVYARSAPRDLHQAWVIDSTLEPGVPGGVAWDMIEAVRNLPDRFENRTDAVAGLERAGYETGVAQWMALNLEAHPEGGFRWRLDFDAMEEMLRDFFRTDAWDVVENPPATVDVHVVRATLSSAIPEPAADRVRSAARSTGRVHLHELEGGHWINVDNPDGVVELLVAQL